MPKIITVTANTAIDLSIEAEGLTSSDNILAKSSIHFARGKGINVAKAIESLDNRVYCLGFAGRQSLAAFNALNTGLLQVDLTAVAGKTRTNVILFDSDDDKEIHIRTTGFTVTDDDWSGIKAKPYLIKPNQQELEDIIGRTLPNEQSIVDTARAIVGQGVQWVYVSRGDKGAIAISESVALSVYVNNVPGKIVSKIGCGDAMVAALAVSMLGGLDLNDTLKSGVVCGTANLFSREPGRFDKNKLSEIADHLVIRRL
jgi:fructose-1-phosphate kinase PfkB-like protein